MPPEAAVDHRRRHEWLRAAGVHVAREEEHARDALRRAPTENQRGTRAVAPADEGCFLYLQRGQYGEDVGSHQLVAVRLPVARSAAVSAAVDQNHAIASLNQRRHLLTPICTVPEA